jgi:hypothetical protein
VIRFGTTTLLSLIGAVCIAACATNRTETDRPASFSVAHVVDLRPARGSLPAARRRAARLSIHAYVEQRRAPLRNLLKNVTIMPLPDAARLMIDDPGPLAALGQHLAVVRLLAHAPEEEEAIEAVNLLLGSDELRRRVLAQIRKPLLRNVPRDGSHESENPEELTANALHEVLSSVPKATAFSAYGSCTDWAAYSNVTRPPLSVDVTISMIATAVGQTRQKASEGIDPQSWDDCDPNFWEEAYLVEVQSGSVVYSGGKPMPATVVRPSGDVYDNETLYEKVKCNGSCALELLLNVSASEVSVANSYIVQYGKPYQLTGKPVIIGNAGHIRVKGPASGPLDVTAVKVLGLQSSLGADWVEWLLTMIDETAHLQHLVCCP